MEASSSPASKYPRTPANWGGRWSLAVRTTSASPAHPGPGHSIEELRERYDRLTPREREVAQLAAQGYSSKELASSLGVSKSTIDNHRAHTPAIVEEAIEHVCENLSLSLAEVA